MTEQNATTRPRGSGSIYQNGSNTWWIKFYVRGIARRESSHSTDRKAAEKLLKRRLAEVETKTYTPRTNVRIDELITDLLSEYREKRRKSITTTAWRWQKHLHPFFTKLPADDLNTDMAKRYCAKREAEGASGATINRELAVLKRAFHLAMKTTPPKVRACPVMPSYTESEARTGFLEDAQYAPLARECGKVGLWLRALLTTAYTFAFRKGELLSMRVKQIDLSDQTIKLEAGKTKNGKPRKVKMTQEVSTLLTACIIGKQPDDFVFTRQNGKPVKGFRKIWATVCCSVGVGQLVCRDCYAEAKAEAKESGKQILIPPPADESGRCPDCSKKRKRGQLRYVGLSVHDLRRSGVRNLRRLGIAETVCMKISGHKTASVFRRYDIVDEADLDDVASRLDAKQNSNAPDFGHDLGIVVENSTKNGAPAQRNFAAAQLPN